MQIDAREAAAILEKHHVRGDDERLQYSYRLRLAQQLLSRIRDEQGRREVLCASRDGQRAYVVVDGCTDEKALKSIRHNLSAGIKGLDRSISKVSLRTQFLERLK